MTHGRKMLLSYEYVFKSSVKLLRIVRSQIWIVIDYFAIVINIDIDIHNVIVINIYIVIDIVIDIVIAIVF